MKPAEMKPAEVYRIIDRGSGEPVGSYSRSYCDEYDFGSVESARTANCHGMFKDHEKYAIAKYRVTYELIDPDCDGSQNPPQPPKSPDEEFLEKLFRGSFMERR